MFQLTLPYHNPLLKELRVETQGKNLEAEAVEGAASWLVGHGLLSLISYSIQLLRSGPAHSELDPHASIFFLMPHGLAHIGQFGEGILSIEVPSSLDSSLPQIDKELIKTVAVT